MTTNPDQPSEQSASQAGPLPPNRTSFAGKMVRSILAILVGTLAGGMTVGLIEVPGMLLHPVPPNIDLSDTEALKARAARAPFAALLGVGIAWTVGPLVGSFIAAAIARWAWFAHGMIIAAIFVALDVMNIRAFPHPTWLVLVGVIGPLASGWFGSALAERTFSPKPTGREPYDMRQKNMAC